MVYYRIPFTPGDTFTYPAGCILVRSYYTTGYMMCEFQSVTSVPTGWEEITGNTFEGACPVVTPPTILSSVQEVIAEDATLEDGEIVITLKEGVTVGTGTLLKFVAPCDCTAANAGLNINGNTYYIMDANSRSLEGTEYGGFWSSGAMLAVLLDPDSNAAYLQNAATSYACRRIDMAGDATITTTTGEVNVASFRKSAALGVVFFYIQLLGASVPTTGTQTVTVSGIDLPFMGSAWQCTASGSIEVTNITYLGTKFAITFENAGDVAASGAVWLRGWYIVE